MQGGRPAGLSSDEEDEFDDFSMFEKTKSWRSVRKALEDEKPVNGEDINKYRQSQVYSAIVSSQLSNIQQELNEGLDPNQELLDGWFPLLVACYSGNYEIAKELVDRGADVNKSKDMKTPLMAACQCPQKTSSSENVLKIVKLLLDRNATLNSVDRYRRNALMFASEHGHFEVVKILVQFFDVNAADNQNWTALFWAVSEKHADIAKFLLENGASTKKIDFRGNDIFFYATGIQSLEQVLPFPKCHFNVEALLNENYDFAIMFSEDTGTEMPRFFNEIRRLLYGMWCESLMELFYESGIDLARFLAADDVTFSEIGVVMNYQKKRLLNGLYKFHLMPWKKSALPVVPLGEFFSTRDFVNTVGNAVMNCVVLASSVKYITINLPQISPKEKALLIQDLIVFKRNLSILYTSVLRMHKLAVLLDKNTSGPADLITKRSIAERKKSKKWWYICGITVPTLLFTLHYNFKK